MSKNLQRTGESRLGEHITIPNTNYKICLLSYNHSHFLSVNNKKVKLNGYKIRAAMMMKGL